MNKILLVIICWTIGSNVFFSSSFTHDDSLYAQPWLERAIGPELKEDYANYNQHSPSKPPSDIGKWILLGIGGWISCFVVWAVIKNIPVIRAFVALAFFGLGILFLVGLFNAKERKNVLNFIGWEHRNPTFSNSNSLNPKLANQLRRLQHLKEKARNNERNRTYFYYLLEKDINQEQFTAKEAKDFSYLLEVFGDEGSR